MLISGVIKVQSKAQKMGENLLNLASARRVKTCAEYSFIPNNLLQLNIPNEQFTYTLNKFDPIKLCVYMPTI